MLSHFDTGGTAFDAPVEHLKWVRRRSGEVVVSDSGQFLLKFSTTRLVHYNLTGGEGPEVKAAVDKVSQW